MRLTGFFAALAVIFGLSVAAGSAFGPDRSGREEKPAHAMDMGAPEAHATYTLQRVGGAGFAFQVIDADGHVVRDFDVKHTKRLHLIAARRDLTGFVHLHPRIDADGTWHAALAPRQPGAYRVFADFAHDGQDAVATTDLLVDGAARYALKLPAVEQPPGYAVALAPVRLRAGDEATLRFTVTRAGRPVTPQPYLGAAGHLVALSDQLDYLHTHPEDGLSFGVTFAEAGRHRLYLQFRDRDVVHTAAFVVEVQR